MGPVGNGQVDELTTRQLERRADGGIEGGKDLPRPCDLLRSRCKDLVQNGELPWVDRRLAEEPEGTGELGLLPQPGLVVEAGIDAVDRRLDAGGA